MHISQRDFKYIILNKTNNFFICSKKNKPFIESLNICFTLKKYFKLHKKFRKDTWFILTRFESFSGELPDITRIKIKVQGRKKKKLFNSFLTFHSKINNTKIILSFLNYIFNFHNYLYINYLFKFRYKLGSFREIVKVYLDRIINFNKNNLSLKINFYHRWLDINRTFIDSKKSKRKRYKTKKTIFLSQIKLKSYPIMFSIKSNYIYLFFIFFVQFIKNYYKLILFLYKKHRNKTIKI